tara:strand:+ start:3635 stop:3871 length:237 start_codon:yes stop_codon:yes gene_type:complete
MLQLDTNTILLIVIFIGILYLIASGVDEAEDKTTNVTLIRPRGRRWGHGRGFGWPWRWRGQYHYGFPYHGHGYRRYYW